jgi:zinc transporter ZupT
MDLRILIGLGLGLTTGIVHFFSENIRPPEGFVRDRVVSFAAGISIAYLFLRLLPETYRAAFYLKEWVFVFLLAGFAVFHLVEKYTYQHADRARLMKELKEIHSASFFIYYFVVGIVLEDLLKVSLLEGTLFAVPVGLHAALSTASLSEIHGDMRQSILVRVILSVSTLSGIVFALLVPIPGLVNNVLVSLIAGVILYIVVREFLPEREKGQPLLFAIGLVAFSALNIAIVFLRR